MSVKNNKGITLIALVVTIIVLLILAGITLNMVLVDDGMISQAQQAKKQSEESSLKDAVSVAKGEAAILNYMDQKAMTEEKIKDLKKADGTTTLFDFGENEYKTNVAKVVDGVPIPIGFAYVEGTKKDTGLIIVDGSGNEFVWVPVDDFNGFAKLGVDEDNWQGVLYDFNENEDGSIKIQEKTAYGQGTTSYREPVNLGDSYDNETNIPGFYPKLYQDEYNKMVESVKTYKGFYVGRYETGGFNTTKVVSKPGEDQASCTNVTWYKMYSMQKELYGESASVTSGMIYGSQWDAIMLWMKDVPNISDSSKKYITDSTDMGNHHELCPSCNGDGCPDCDGKGFVATAIKTGSNSAYSVNNIFDLAGNFYEWTQEANSTSFRVYHGYRYDDRGLSFPASNRGKLRPFAVYDYLSSRLQLYIK